MIQNILILCIGNICRSPIAEVLFIERLKGSSVKVICSAGLAALVGKPADPMSQLLMQERGLDLSFHRARQLTGKMLFESDLILTMTRDQQEEVQAKYQSVYGRVHCLGKWGEFDVIDPFQRPRAVFEQATALIEQGIEEWCTRLWA